MLLCCSLVVDIRETFHTPRSGLKQGQDFFLDGIRLASFYQEAIRAGSQRFCFVIGVDGQDDHLYLRPMLPDPSGNAQSPD